MASRRSQGRVRRVTDASVDASHTPSHDMRGPIPSRTRSGRPAFSPPEGRPALARCGEPMTDDNAQDPIEPGPSTSPMPGSGPTGRAGSWSRWSRSRPPWRRSGRSGARGGPSRTGLARPRARDLSLNCRHPALKLGRILTRRPQYPPSPARREVGMSIFQDAILRFGRTIMSYAGDAVFLQAAVSAAANVIVADGDVAEEEIESAISRHPRQPDPREILRHPAGRAGTLRGHRPGQDPGRPPGEPAPGGRHRGAADRPAPGRLPDRRRRGRFRRHQRGRAQGARRDRRGALGRQVGAAALRRTRLTASRPERYATSGGARGGAAIPRAAREIRAMPDLAMRARCDAGHDRAADRSPAATRPVPCLTGHDSETVRVFWYAVQQREQLPARRRPAETAWASSSTR